MSPTRRPIVARPETKPAAAAVIASERPPGDEPHAAHDGLPVGPSRALAAAPSGAIRVERVSIELGQGAQAFEALHDVSFEVEAGQFVCVLGPSGCGKSTLLGALAGHLRPSRGRLQVDGHAVLAPGPERGLVFQHHTLFPWKSVLDNVAFGLKMQGVARIERHERARALLREVGLEGFESRYPAQLSGGMQQRVEIARVLINRPRLLLMDEPFGALDALTRVRMQSLLLELWSQVRTTVVFITHDIDEALYLADRVLVMSPRPGRIVADIASPFARPRQPRLMTDPDFVALKRQCLALLHEDPTEHPVRGQGPGGPARPRLNPLGLPTAAAQPWRFAV